MPKYQVSLTRTEYGQRCVTVEVTAIDVKNAKRVAREEADFDGEEISWCDSGDVEVDDVQEIESDESEEESDDEV